MIAWILVIIGALNWGLTAFGIGIQNWLPNSLSMIIFILVGLSGLYELFTHKGRCKDCDAGGMSKPMGQM